MKKRMAKWYGGGRLERVREREGGGGLIIGGAIICLRDAIIWNIPSLYIVKQTYM